MLKCTHSQHEDRVELDSSLESGKTKWTVWPSLYHKGPGKWMVNVEYPCCGHEGRKFEVWCEKWTDTIFNQSGIPVKCPYCFHMFKDVCENVKIIGLA